MEKELELNDAMVRRSDELDNATYDYLKLLLQLDDSNAEANLPWDISLLREVLDSTIGILEEHGHPVCNPYISDDETHEQLCSLEECGCCECQCQENEQRP